MPMRLSRKTQITLLVLGLLIGGYLLATRYNLNTQHSVGEAIDTFNGVTVFYNGGVNHTDGRNTAADGYNLGLRYQCVEFVKRYYYQKLGHKMPDSMGHAKDFFDATLADGALNPSRNLLQYRNGSTQPPQVEDILVFAPWLLNRYGHVAIVSRVESNRIEIVQQNPGPWGPSRENYSLTRHDQGWYIGHDRALGWLRRAAPVASAPVASAPAMASAPGTASTAAR